MNRMRLLRTSVSSLAKTYPVINRSRNCAIVAARFQSSWSKRRPQPSSSTAALAALSASRYERAARNTAAALVGTAAVALLAMSTQSNYAEAEPITQTDSSLPFWEEGWKEGRTSFHRPSINAVLNKNREVFLPSSLPSKSQKILVPLCGKTLDLPYLASLKSTAEVIGVEAVQQAVTEFTQEHVWLKMQCQRPSKETPSKFKTCQSTVLPLTFLQGDFFDLSKSEISQTGGQASDGSIDKVWDRASLVAIHPSLRQKYVDTIYNVLKPGGQILLCVLNRAAGTEQARKAGPPFSVDEAEVRRLYDSKRFKVVKLSTEDATLDKHLQNGLTCMLEEVYLVTKL